MRLHVAASLRDAEMRVSAAGGETALVRRIHAVGTFECSMLITSDPLKRVTTSQCVPASTRRLFIVERVSERLGHVKERV